MILRLVGFVVMLLGLQLVTGPIALMPQAGPWRRFGFKLGDQGLK